jgi:predicted MFS family arabinose efflux permease
MTTAIASDQPVKIPSERVLIFLIGAIQFVNTLDFMMVMPLGPDFAEALGIPTSHIGYVGGSYTAAAAFSGVLGSLFLDRFDRRIALACAMLGLVIGTAAGGFATGPATLYAARVLAGLFGGPATALSLAVIADVIPPERRGRAMGAVMGAFSVASVFGVPAGLQLATMGGWRLPFFAVAALGLVITAVAIFALPPLRIHLQRAQQNPVVKGPLLNRTTGLSLTMTAMVMGGLFAVIPNVSAFFQHNLGYPRERLGLLYMFGGVASFITMRFVGPLVDRFGATRLIVVGTLLHCAVLIATFMSPISVPAMLLFVVFMVSGSVRMVPLGALSSRVPEPHERARFMSAQSAVQHFASALGAVGASLLLTATPDGNLVGMNRVALVAMLLALVVPLLSRFLEARVVANESTPRAVQPI